MITLLAAMVLSPSQIFLRSRDLAQGLPYDSTWRCEVTPRLTYCCPSGWMPGRRERKDWICKDPNSARVREPFVVYRFIGDDQ